MAGDSEIRSAPAKRAEEFRDRHTRFGGVIAVEPRGGRLGEDHIHPAPGSGGATAPAVDGSGDRLAMGSTTGNLWITEDGGEAWRHISAHLPPIHTVRFA